MPLLTSRAPRLTLAEHPEFPLMLAVALDRFHCTLREIREDYWHNRIWRALSTDPELQGYVSRAGLHTVLLTGKGGHAPPKSAAERERRELHARCRIAADTRRLPEGWGLQIRWAEGPVTVQTIAAQSLIAQVVSGDPRWLNLDAYKTDLAPVRLPACTAESVAA